MPPEAQEEENRESLGRGWPGGRLLPATVMPPTDRKDRLLELAGLFLKLGFTAFGGPAAHIAIMHDESVRRRRWLTDQAFLDLVGATHLIPGPNSTEMAIHIGLLRAGWPGLIVAGLCFILPAMTIVLGLAWAYVNLGATPPAEGLLYGVKPVVIAVVAQALWQLARQPFRRVVTASVAILALVLSWIGANEILLLVAGGLVVMLSTTYPRWRGMTSGLWFAPVALAGAAPYVSRVAFSLPLLFLSFLKIGSVLYGSGYVLLAFLRADFVVRFGWLTDQQLIDAVAIGQVTPGPVFTTATFIGYLLGGFPAAFLATLGIFLPSFLFVAISHPLIPRMRRSPALASFLDGVVASSLGLMGAVTWELGRAALSDPLTILIGLISFVLLVRFRVNSTGLIAAGAAVGLAASLLA